MHPVNGPRATYFQNISPIQEDENTLTAAETTLLVYLQPWIQDCLEKKINIVYIGASQLMQTHFTEWVKKNFTARKYTDQELDVNSLVSSIWGKIKNRVENQLKTSKNQADIHDEKSGQEFANLAMNEILSRGLG